MSARRKERLADEGLKQFQQDINDVLWDKARIPEDPGDKGEFAGYFPATYPWVEIDVSTNDVTFSKKLKTELAKFSDDFLNKSFDLVEHNGQRCIFFQLSIKARFYQIHVKLYHTSAPIIRPRHGGRMWQLGQGRLAEHH